MFGRSHDTEVVVVGAGPVGLFSALSLASRGISVEVFDAGWRPAGHSYALALHPKTIDLFTAAGLSDLLASGRRIDRIGFYDERGRKTQVSLARLAIPHPYLLSLPQSRLEDALERAVIAAGGRVHWNRRLADIEQNADGVVLRVDHLDKDSMGYATTHTEWVVTRTETVTARLCIGADGFFSTVRRQLNIDYPAVGPAEVYAIFEFDLEDRGDAELIVALGRARSSAMWPLPDGRARWSFQIPGGDVDTATRLKSRLATQLDEHHAPSLPAGSFRELVQERAGWFEGIIGTLHWSIEARFERHLAQRFGDRRVWLAGDAAHVTTPIGMASMNIGMLEAAELAAGCAASLRGGGSLDALAEYGVAARRRWRPRVSPGQAVQPTLDASPWVRGHMVGIMEAIPASTAELRGLANQLGLTIDIR